MLIYDKDLMLPTGSAPPFRLGMQALIREMQVQDGGGTQLASTYPKRD